jgi:hypothetical protein
MEPRSAWNSDKTSRSLPPLTAFRLSTLVMS